jgi:serine protease Do
MSRTRDWVKFGSLIGVTLALAVAFVAVVDLPQRSEAQQPSSVLRDRPAPVQAAQPVVDLGNAFTSVAEVVRPAVVYIDATREVGGAVGENHPELPAPFDRFFQQPQQPRLQRGTGSGFIISPDGYIITNNHVVEGSQRLDVQLFDGRKFSNAEVVGRDPNTDIAVVKIDADDLPSVALGDSDSLRVGEWVLAIGNPLGDAFSFTVTAGIVSGRGRVLGGLQQGRQWSISDFIQTDAAINPGNSGGPLVNIRGQVVGVNSAIASETGLYAGYSFAVPINLARIVADQLIREGKVTRAALGVQVAAADDEDAEYVGLDAVRGVVVQGFPEGGESPARNAGIEIGDVIVAVDGEPVDYVAQLQQLVGFKRPGERTEVTVMRAGGERRTFTVRLTEAGSVAEQQTAAGGATEPEESFDYESRLGIEVEELTPDMARAAGVPNDEMGLMITGVDQTGPARDDLFATSPRQGIVAVITHVNGERIRTRTELEDALDAVRPGGVISLQLYEIVQGTPRSRVVRFRVGG